MQTNLTTFLDEGEIFNSSEKKFSTIPDLNTSNWFVSVKLNQN